jgi:hypothetical protein
LEQQDELQDLGVGPPVHATQGSNLTISILPWAKVSECETLFWNDVFFFIYLHAVPATGPALLAVPLPVGPAIPIPVGLPIPVPVGQAIPVSVKPAGLAVNSPAVAPFSKFKFTF